MSAWIGKINKAHNIKLNLIKGNSMKKSNEEENENLMLDGDFPRYISDPFEVIYSDDPRYENALTRQQIKKMTASKGTGSKKGD